MKSPPLYAVHYISVRARAEPIHLLLAYAGVPCVRHDYSLKEVGAKAHKARFGQYAQLPALELLETGPKEGRVLFQSGTILRYLAKRHGLVPADDLDAAAADEIFELSQELAKSNPLVNLAPPEGRSEALAAFLDKGAGNGSGYPIGQTLGAARDKLGDRAFFGGDAPCFADFNMFHYVDHIDTIAPKVLDDAQELVEWMRRVSSLPNVAAYLKDRPAAETQGKAGALIRDDKARRW